MIAIWMVWGKLIIYFSQTLHAHLPMWSEASGSKVLKALQERRIFFWDTFLYPSQPPRHLYLAPRAFTIPAGTKHSSDVSPGMTSCHFKQYHLDNVLFSFLNWVKHWGTCSQKKAKLWKHRMRKKETGHPNLPSTTSWCRKGFNLEKSLSHFNIFFMVWVCWIINDLDGNRRSLATIRL